MPRLCVTVLWLSALASSCAVIELERQAEVLTTYPVIYGEVRPQGWGGDPTVLVLSKDAPEGEPHEIEYLVHHDPGPFYYYVEPGTYQLALFEDRSGRLGYEPGEDPALIYTTPIVATGEGDGIQVVLEGHLSTETRLPDRFDISQESAHTRIALGLRNVGRVVPLDAPEMSLELGQAGMWEPMKYMEEVQAGIFFLEAFDPDKIPVIFVHGIGGAPVQFEALSAALDRERYQPWFFAYPSIFPLHMVAEALNGGLDIVRRQHEFDRVLLVAHSMGGLVTRAYLNEYSWSRHDYEVGLFVSLASPFGGESGAAIYPGEDHGKPGPFRSWIKTMKTQEGDRPHIAWTDMAPDSAFLANLYDEPLPDGLTYALGFAFDPARSLSSAGDGTVTLESQLRPDAQREAARERGFLMGHDDVLVEPDAIKWVMDRVSEADERRSPVVTSHRRTPGSR